MRRSVVLRMDPTVLVVIIILGLWAGASMKKEMDEEALAYWEANPARAELFREQVEAEKLAFGMNRDEARFALGSKKYLTVRISRSSNMGLHVETWSWGSYATSYITFTNGLLTGSGNF